MMNPIIALKMTELEEVEAVQDFLSPAIVYPVLQAPHSGAATVPAWVMQLAMVVTQMEPLVAGDFPVTQVVQTVAEE